jgi:hypothetical protein
MAECVKLFVGLLTAKEEFFTKVKEALEKVWGKVEEESSIFPFLHTHYYDEELGFPILRKFFVFKGLFELEQLYKVKLLTNSLEKDFSVGGRRCVNIDPGYICLSKIVLFTHKDWVHRIYIKDGVYAESTLYFKEGSFHPFEWTYPDYRSKDYIHFFNKVRSNYKKELRAQKQS